MGSFPRKKLRTVFNQISKLFRTHNLNLKLKLRLLLCILHLEPWRRQQQRNWRHSSCGHYQNIMSARYIKHPNTPKTKNEIIYTVKPRKLQYLGHILRNETKYELLKCILQEKIQDKRTNLLAKELKNLVWNIHHRTIQRSNH